MSSQSSPPFNADSTNASAPYVFSTRILIGAIILLVGIICFILMLHVYARWFLRRSSRLYFRSQGRVAPSAHYTTGLDKATISQLPIFVYTASIAAASSSLEASDKAGKLHQSRVAVPAPECSVCLSDFQENERGRMLPSCKHVFHTQCIDMWLLSHSTCPLCRANVVPPMAMLTEVISTDQPHQGQGAMEPSQGSTEANNAVLVQSLAVEYPCNVLFWGNQTHVISSQESPMSLLALAHVAGARAMPQITIDIPPRDQGNVLGSASGHYSTQRSIDQEAGSSQPLKSPSLRTSIKRMLSRQSSRQKSPRQEGNEDISPK